MIRRPPRSTQSRSSAASDVYKRQLHTGSVDRISPGIAESIGRGHAEGRRVEPLVGGAGARSEDRLAGVICPDGILSQDRARVGGVAENRDREWEPALQLEHGGEPPVAA